MKIYFYDNKIREFCFSDQKHQALLARVATRTCVSADNWEPLLGTNGLYSVRTNGKDRLLFIYIEDTLNNNKTAILVWRHIPHNYSPIIKTFKKSKNLSHFKPSEEPVSKDEKGKASEEIEETKEKPEFSEAYGEFKETSELNNYFVLDNEQQEAVYRPLPVLLEGGPGSGKTTVLQTILEQQLPLLENKKILCLSKSKFLIDAITEEWTLSPLYAANKERVDIRTYESFFEEVLRNAGLPLNYQSENFKAWLPIRLQNKSEKLAYKNLKLEKICTENADNEDLKLQLAYAELQEEFQAYLFSAWFQERFSNKNNKKRKGRKPTFPIADSNLVYEEFRIASGYKDQASYVKSGDKQSSLNVNQRDALYTYYTQWISHLKSNQLYISDFFDLTPYLGNIQDRYSKLLIDEGQDFSHLQLNLLVKLLPAGQFVVCVDQRQNLFDSNPKSIYLKNIINEHCRTDNPIEPLVLSNAYRCPGEVMRFAVGVFNELRRQFTPVTKQEAPIEIPPDNEGRVVLLDPKHLSSEEDKREFALLQEKTKSIDTCIITDETNFDDAERLFPDFIKRFTPKQAKGLGAKCVILLNILNHPFFHEINKLLENGNLKNLPKAAKYCTLLSECFVAATRAELEVYMVQENMDSHNLANIKKRIEFVMNTNKAPEHKQEPVTITTSTPEELKQEALNLYKKGLQEEAFDILTKRLKMSKEEAFALLNELTMENVEQQKEKKIFEEVMLKASKMVYKDELFAAIEKGDFSKLGEALSAPDLVLDETESTNLIEKIISSPNAEKMFEVAFNSKKIVMSQASSRAVFVLIYKLKEVRYDNAHKMISLLNRFINHDNFEINVKDENGDTPLSLAVTLLSNIREFAGNELGLKRLGTPISLLSTAISTLLHSKRINPYLDDIEKLLNVIKDENVPFEIVVDILKHKNTDLMQVFPGGIKDSIMHKIVFRNTPRHIQILEKLFEINPTKKMPINHTNKLSTSPLNLAFEGYVTTKGANLTILKYLLKHPEIDLSLLTRKNDIYELLGYIYEKCSIEIAIDIIDLLARADRNRIINWNYQSRNKKITALMITCKNNSDLSLTCFSYLTAVRNVDVMLFDSFGCSALFYAILYKNSTIFRHFILHKPELFNPDALTREPKKLETLKNSFKFLLDAFASVTETSTKNEVIMSSKKVAANLFPTDERFKSPTTQNPTEEELLRISIKRLNSEAADIQEVMDGIGEYLEKNPDLDKNPLTFSPEASAIVSDAVNTPEEPDSMKKLPSPY